MWLHEHQYVSVYLAGCVAVVLLSFMRIAVFWAINWILKANIVQRNLKKLQPPEKRPFLTRAGLFLAVVTFEAALSWINVPIILWQTTADFFRTMRELLASVPEEVKQLKYPLRNNADLTRESVWAYVQAFNVKLGNTQPSNYDLIASLDEIHNYYPSFDSIGALRQLDSLKSFSPGRIDDAIAEIVAR